MIRRQDRYIWRVSEISPTGKIVLLSVGMSNTTDEFCSGGSATCDSFTFMGQAAANAGVNHTTLAIANGAAGDRAASTWDAPTLPNYDRVRDQVLAPAGLSEKQVQVVWVKEADPGPTVSLPSSSADAYALETYLGDIMRALKTRYPNVHLVFLSSRIYGGYATTTLNPEPYAYESGFAVKWLIQAQIDQMRNSGTVVDTHAGDLNDNTVGPLDRVGAIPVGQRDHAALRQPHLAADRLRVGRYTPGNIRPHESGHHAAELLRHLTVHATVAALRLAARTPRNPSPNSRCASASSPSHWLANSNARPCDRVTVSRSVEERLGKSTGFSIHFFAN
jgi:hypothetical protein